MKTYKYLKCYLCLKSDKCAVEVVLNGKNLLCDYGTILSLWKWFARITSILLVILILISPCSLIMSFLRIPTSLSYF